MKLSIVLAGRNDGHCGDFIERMNYSLATLPSSAEIIMVEWNPPPETPRLAGQIHRRAVRVITVPQDFHSQMHGNEVLPFFEYRAKNAGIRRANGEWILSMNPDILLCEEMRSALAGDNFEETCFYQAARHDMKNGELIQVCHGPGDFILMHRSRWFAFGGYLDLVSYSHLDSLLMWTLEKAGMSKVELPYPILHQEHDRSIHKTRMTIHSSDMPRFIGQRNDENWGLAEMHLPETRT